MEPELLEYHQVRSSSKFEVKLDALEKQPLFSIRIPSKQLTLQLRPHPVAARRGDALKSDVLLKNLFVELRSMYRDFRGVEFLEDEIARDPGDDRARAGGDGLGDPRWGDEGDAGDLRRGRFGPEELYVRAGRGVYVAEERLEGVKLAPLVRRTSSLCPEGWEREAGIETLFMGCDNSYQRG